MISLELYFEKFRKNIIGNDFEHSLETKTLNDFPEEPAFNLLKPAEMSKPLEEALSRLSAENIRFVMKLGDAKLQTYLFSYEKKMGTICELKEKGILAANRLYRLKEDARYPRATGYFRVSGLHHRVSFYKRVNYYKRGLPSI